VRKGIQRIFSDVVKTYELVNHVLTFGLDIIWRRKAARLASRNGGSHWLDVCSGTGEMALNLSRQADKKVKIVSVDFCPPMLERGKEKRNIPNLSPVLADAVCLPFPDETFDIVTISFATRNINPRKDVLIDHLKEFCRVLKPGGSFINLETSQPSVKMIQTLFHLYIKLTVKPLGYFISGSKAGYDYLSFTIPRFYPSEEFSSIIREAGFSQVTHRPLFFGVAAIHSAKK
jgi:demethylmenaquinone methyltransferase/2-methoxy-6-polyprenyl-1,4-benzoquinol methylase